MPRVQTRCQQSKRRNHCKIDVVSHGDKPRVSFPIQFGNPSLITRVDFGNAGVLIDKLWLVIAHLVDLVSDLVEVRLPDDYPHQFCATEFSSMVWSADPGYSKRV